VGVEVDAIGAGVITCTGACARTGGGAGAGGSGTGVELLPDSWEDDIGLVGELEPGLAGSEG